METNMNRCQLEVFGSIGRINSKHKATKSQRVEIRCNSSRASESSKYGFGTGDICEQMKAILFHG